MKATMITIVTMRNFASGCYLIDPTDAYQILISQRGKKMRKKQEQLKGRVAKVKGERKRRN